MTTAAETKRRPDIPDNATPREYFNHLMKDRINLSTIPKIKKLNVLVEFHITGEKGGKWGLLIENGWAKDVIDESGYPYPNKPNCSFKMDSSVFLEVVRKETTPQKAFFARKIDVKGDIFLALKSNVLVNYL